MRRVLFAQWGLGVLFLFAAATSGCKTSRAAQPLPSKPPPDTSVSAEPCLTEEEARTRKDLFKMFNQRQPLYEPEKAEAQRYEARAKLIETFERWLPERLRKRIDVSKVSCVESNLACYVDVKYPDWKTFVEVDRSVMDPQTPSPFMTFPGPRYRSGRVHIEEKNRKLLATWFLALQLRPPYDPNICKQGRDN